MSLPRLFKKNATACQMCAEDVLMKETVRKGVDCTDNYLLYKYIFRYVNTWKNSCYLIIL